MTTTNKVAAILVSVAASVVLASEVTVHYYNEARIPERALAEAIETANSAMRRAEIKVRWVNCYAEPQNCRTANTLQVSVVDTMSEVRTPSFSMGYSLLPQTGNGVYAKVMWNRVLQYAKAFDLPATKVLGNVIAHEIGHLLLGTGEHSHGGIMKARWSGSEKTALAGGRLAFQGHEAAKMRRRVAEMAK